jgi:hypothetical protein
VQRLPDRRTADAEALAQLAVGDPFVGSVRALDDQLAKPPVDRLDRVAGSNPAGDGRVGRHGGSLPRHGRKWIGKLIHLL